MSNLEKLKNLVGSIVYVHYCDGYQLSGLLTKVYEEQDILARFFKTEYNSLLSYNFKEGIHFIENNDIFMRCGY